MTHQLLKKRQKKGTILPSSTWQNVTYRVTVNFITLFVLYSLYNVFFPETNAMIKMMRKTKNKIFAIPVAAPAIPPKPKNPAIRAITKKIKEYLNIT